MRVITANVNGIRAAARRGGLDRLRVQEPDVVALQEVRADDTRLRKVLADAGLAHWHLAHSPSSAVAGHAGVALLSRHPFLTLRTGGGRAFDNDAGWRIDYQLATRPLAERATEAWVGRASSYAQRWSDHAPLVVAYELDHPGWTS